MRSRVLSVAAVLLAVLAPGWVASPASATTRTVCGPSLDETVCLVIDSGPLSGVTTISATRSGARDTGTMEFTLNGNYLNFEYQRPYSFVWPTQKKFDGTYRLSARLHVAGSYGDYVTTSVTLDNGIERGTSIPKSPSDWQSVFSPRSGNEYAAVGNLGAEKPDELALEHYIQTQKPSIFGYLGEVHEFGSWATTLDHYGLADYDDPVRHGTKWGQMASYTLPTPGNHQRDYISEFRDYWHERPLWSTTVWRGVRIYDLTSECKANGGCLAGGGQETWLASQLAENHERCVIAQWHRPVVSMDAKRSGPTMDSVWSMLAKHGGDLVLNADTRDMEQALPMNASLQTGRSDSHMVELISGAGAARWVTSNTSDKRMAWRLYEVPGAVWVSPNAAGTALTWEFRDSTGKVLRSGSVGC